MEYIETRFIKNIEQINDNTYRIYYDDGEEKIVNRDYYEKHLLKYDKDNLGKMINDFIIDTKIEENTQYSTMMSATYRNGNMFIVDETNESINYFYSPKEIKDKGSFFKARLACCEEEIKNKAIEFIDHLYASAKFGFNDKTK